MNVVVGIVVNSISEVQEQLAKEKAEADAAKKISAVQKGKDENGDKVKSADSVSAEVTDIEALKREISVLRQQLEKVEDLMNGVSG